MSVDDPVETLIEAAERLLNQISYDMHGMAVGTTYSGGHGGLISQDTFKRCDELRRAIYTIRKAPTRVGGA